MSWATIIVLGIVTLIVASAFSKRLFVSLLSFLAAGWIVLTLIPILFFVWVFLKFFVG